MRKITTNFQKGLFYTILAMICVISVDIVGSLVLKHGASVATLLSYRFWVGTILFYITVRCRGYSLKIHKEDRWTVFTLSALLFGHLLTYWYGVAAMNNLPIVSALHFTYPIWIAIASALFFGEYFSKYRIWALWLGFIGALFTVGVLPFFHVDANALGILLVLFSSFFMAGILMTGKEIMAKYPPFVLLFWNFLFGSILISVFQPFGVTFHELAKVSWAYLLITAVVSTYALWLFYYAALKYVRPSDISIFSPMRKAVTIFLAFFLLSQSINGYQIIGVALILASGWLLSKEYAKT